MDDVVQMSGDMYGEGYWERGEGSNYHAYGDDPGWDVTVRRMIGTIGKEGRWLEVACAKGWFVHHARARGVDCYGVDISPYAISQAPADVKRYVLLNDAADLIFDDDTFEVTCGWEFMEHVPEHDVDRVLSEIERVTMPGGWVFLRIALADGAQADHDDDATHFTVMPRAWWANTFRRRGWRHATLFEEHLDDGFRDRDWQGRFFVYRLPDRANS